MSIKHVEAAEIYRAALDVMFHSDAADQEITIRDYFHRLFQKLWEKQECFDAKRPFNHSDWDYDVIKALSDNGFINKVADADDYQEAHAFVSSLIRFMLYN